MENNENFKPFNDNEIKTGQLDSNKVKDEDTTSAFVGGLFVGLLTWAVSSLVKKK